MMEFRSIQKPGEQKARELITALVALNGGNLEGKVRLYKAFYWAHVFFFERQGAMLSDWDIVHMPHGPGIDDCERLLNRCVQKGMLTRREHVRGVAGEHYESLGEPPRLTEAERDACVKALERVRDKTNEELSRDSHEHSWSWQSAERQGKHGARINFAGDVLGEEEYTQLQGDVDDTNRLLGELFDASH